MVLENVLIISSNDKNTEVIINMIKPLKFQKISTVKSSGDARRIAYENKYDLFIINSPVQNDSAEDLAKELVAIGASQVVFIVKNDMYDYMSSRVENFGVVTVAKPLSKQSLWTALKVLKAVNNRLNSMLKANMKLTQKIDDIKIVDRAKYLLISCLGMSEPDAHKYIEKNAMDLRKSRREVAENILKTYEN